MTCSECGLNLKWCNKHNTYHHASFFKVNCENMETKMSLAKGIKYGRKAIIIEHRRAQFEEAFDKYINGEVSAKYVAERRNKLREIGGLK